MIKSFISVFMVLLFVQVIQAQEQGRKTINLNGIWEFEQTKTAFPPQKFTRKIPVPGLIHLAEPRIDQYNKLFIKPDTVQNADQHDLLKLHYEPRYNWYRKIVKIPKELANRQAMISILKSKYVTSVYINGRDAGHSIACYTPVEFPITHAIRFGQDNEILIRVGDRAWLPPEAAGSTDKEKVNYLPGIWDDVLLSFTGSMRIHRALMLPDLKNNQVNVKLLIRNFYPAQTLYGGKMQDSCTIHVQIFEKMSQQAVTTPFCQKNSVKRDNLTQIELIVPLKNARLWTPDDPFLYEARIQLFGDEKISDQKVVTFGMREFGRNGKFFTLNKKRIYLRGTNITLHRFFEDLDCAALPWDRKWVTKLMGEIPKKLNWNAMRVCVGIAPDFWYDIADESGLMLQNEWLYWQNHGWDEQIRKEYTDWVWQDGNHPSIVIWDAINENWDPYIGNILIPELKRLDPTRIWDAGYMTGEHMTLDEMDEPHPYNATGHGLNPEQYRQKMEKEPYRLGDMSYWTERMADQLSSSAAQLVNEYGWIWLWRDGRPAKLTLNQYAYYLGKNATPAARQEFQAYWLQLETEGIRAERSLAGVLAFCYLANNYGFTGDWFMNPINELVASPTLKWFQHCFASTAVFIDLVDERYTKHLKPHTPDSEIIFNLVGINDLEKDCAGQVTLKLWATDGKIVTQQKYFVQIPAYNKILQPVSLRLPAESGGYLLVAEFQTEKALTHYPVLSRRYIKVGELPEYRYHELTPEQVD